MQPSRNAPTVISHQEKQMHKLKLESLSIETFEPSRGDGATARGTVQAHAWSRPGQQTCGGMSCDYACITLYDETCRYVCA